MRSGAAEEQGIRLEQTAFIAGAVGREHQVIPRTRRCLTIYSITEKRKRKKKSDKTISDMRYIVINATEMKTYKL